jgi:hypothetical protein
MSIRSLLRRRKGPAEGPPAQPALLEQLEPRLLLSSWGGGGDNVPPVASLISVDSPVGPSLEFTVQYEDAASLVDASSISDNDIEVTGPSYAETAELVDVTSAIDATPIVATYRIPAPGGVWGPADNGTYTVTLLANQVADTASPPNLCPGGTLGAFDVSLDGPVVLTTPAVSGIVDLGDTYRVEWAGGDSDDTVTLWAYGPQGWQKIAQNIAATDGGFDWDTSTVTQGWHCFEAKVNPGDGSGWYQSYSPAWIRIVRPDNHAPTIAFTTPTAGQEILPSQGFELQWTTGDADGDPLHVTLWAYSASTGWFRLPGAQWLDASPGSYTVDTSSWMHGWYCFSAWVNDGAVAVPVKSASWLHVLCPPAMMPTFTWQTPQQGDKGTVGGTYDLTWDIEIPTGEQMQVSLWAYNETTGWTRIAFALDAETEAFEWDTSGLDPGWYCFSAWVWQDDISMAVPSDYWLQVLAP